MNSGFINRLVGTSIVVIAAIVFIPNILDGEKVHYKEGFKAIPERSEFKTIDLQESIDEKVAQAEPLKQEQIEDIAADDDVLTSKQSQYAAEPEIVEASIEPQTAPEPVAKAPEPVKAKPIAPRKSEENLTDMAYVIQLGSFSHAANVKALQAKLKAKGFKTFTKPIKTPNGTLTKVFVGPSLDKGELTKKLPELKALTKLNGKVTQYSVSN
ncbi:MULTISPECIES: SPOR domain-containing protein [Pseudoalteromonas]|uniref:SPOR domain-containing protein n=2 Tax=Pseudoalteromonas TaxID=53246 RepID=A0AAD0TZ79_9GAMM|nr:MULTISPECIES: SPOR domain-containing protein [Pseudoalteromonas]MCK8105993.1 SPOR domain-containing protein [Pseudoalteromonas sp. 2CM41L]MDY6888503.1 SPOR domain-containing protein [Pseudomonadota bacterium]GEK78377.1 cell division protein DedD [Pseudoalteromonas atlantica]AYM87184.1 SPOR domain-containing protein [Pseudoalteromonas agarivorans]KPV91472.1 cell division protein DedD [Pseudoalteromonas sp. P1-30]